MTFLEAIEYTRRIRENTEDSASSAIFTGMNVSEDFWDNFILVCNNKEGMASLLNVSPEKIASWPAAIRTNLDKIKDNPEEKEKTKVLDTGDMENG